MKSFFQDAETYSASEINTHNEYDSVGAIRTMTLRSVDVRLRSLAYLEESKGPSSVASYLLWLGLHGWARLRPSCEARLTAVSLQQSTGDHFMTT